jgi:hypothetical protein
VKALAFILLAACHDPSFAVGAACERNDGCPPGQRCVEGLCLEKESQRPLSFADSGPRADTSFGDLDAAPVLYQLTWTPMSSGGSDCVDAVMGFDTLELGTVATYESTCGLAAVAASVDGVDLGAHALWNCDETMVDTTTGFTVAVSENLLTATVETERTIPPSANVICLGTYRLDGVAE